MATVESLNKKIEELKNSLEKLKETIMDEKSQLQAQIAIIEKCEEVIENEELFLNYDFTDTINLMENYNFSIDDLAKILSDIQKALMVRHQLNLTSDDMPLEQTQITTIQDFKTSLKNVKEAINAKIQNVSKTDSEEEKIKNLEKLKNVLEGVGVRKYVTTEMFQDFYEEFDILNLPYEEAQELLEAFFKTKNFSVRQGKERVDLQEVINLFTEFVSPSLMRFFTEQINDHKDEIITNIDLDNTREILQFLKEKDLINQFEMSALLKVALYGKADYIKEEVYPRIMAEHPDVVNNYFTTKLATVWIKEKGFANYRTRPFRTSKSRDENKDSGRLYATCHTVDYEEFAENVELLKANRNLFDAGASIDDDSANLNLKILPTWLLKKNINLCKLFKIGIIATIPPTSLERGDIEDKIHLAIELGLFNPPMSPRFLDIDKQIVRNDEFQSNTKKKKLYNQSIRNYFQRFLCMLATKSINEYAYLAYKLQSEGYVQFYNDFFSDARAGMGKDPFTRQERITIGDKQQMDSFVSDHFVTDWYPDFIRDYDEYDGFISEFIESGKSSRLDEEGYFDDTILDDDLIKELEENNSVYDTITVNDEVVQRKNEFIYLFGDRIISRYKVLHNASILKGLYGKFNREMLMTSIVRNSFLDMDSFQLIHDQVMGRSRSL